jgi:hypothetical protein
MVSSCGARRWTSQIGLMTVNNNLYFPLLSSFEFFARPSEMWTWSGMWVFRNGATVSSAAELAEKTPGVKFI